MRTKSGLQQTVTVRSWTFSNVRRDQVHALQRFTAQTLKKTANPNAPILSIIEGFPVTIKKAGEKGHKRIHDMRVMGFLKRV